jgi:hypothetical protein
MQFRSAIREHRRFQRAESGSFARFIVLFFGQLSNEVLLECKEGCETFQVRLIASDAMVCRRNGLGIRRYDDGSSFCGLVVVVVDVGVECFVVG